MIGVYDYTVILTYLSVISAGLGIVVSLSETGHPYIGVFFLLFCGLCDAFDGKVARMKKNRTEMEKKFGIQIDSLADILAFGVLPVCIGHAMIRVCPTLNEVVKPHSQSLKEVVTLTILFVVMLMYMLAALIRLAYYNVTEEERQETEDTVRKTYLGLPVTSAALIFPTVLLGQFVFLADITIVYFVVMFFAAIAFVSKIHIPKPGTKGIMYMLLIGAVEFAVLTYAWFH